MSGTGGPVRATRLLAGTVRHPSCSHHEAEDIDPSEPAVPGVEVAGGEATWRKYAGKVIAVARGEVLASGDTWATAIDAAKRAGLSFETVEFMFVPNATVIG